MKGEFNGISPTKKLYVSRTLRPVLAERGWHGSGCAGGSYSTPIVTEQSHRVPKPSHGHWTYKAEAAAYATAAETSFAYSPAEIRPGIGLAFLVQTNYPHFRAMKKILTLFCLFALCAISHATTTVSGTIGNLGTGTVASSFVRFYLRGCKGGQPRVGGTAIIAPSQGGIFYFDLAADASGVVSGTIYSTRDAAGTGNGEIECFNSRVAEWYGMIIFYKGQAGPEVAVQAQNGVTLNITNVVPASTPPPLVPGPSFVPGTPGSYYATTPDGSTLALYDDKNYDVKRNYGALGNNSTDDYAAIQAALDASCALNTSPGGHATHPVVVFPPGTYRVSKPLRVNCSNQALFAPGGRSSVNLFPTTNGPSLVVAPTVNSGFCATTGCSGNSLSNTTVAGLTGSGGLALHFPANNFFWYNVRIDSTEGELDGLAAFSAEAIIKAGTLVGSHNVIASASKLSSSVAQASSMSLGLESDTGRMSCQLRIGGVLKSAIGGLAVVGVATNIALTYDGANLKCWQDGSVVATTAATGTVTQAVSDDMLLGPVPQVWPETTIQSNGPFNMDVDSVRLSNNARTPTGVAVKLASDSHTLGLFNWDNQFDIFTTMHSKDGDWWMPLKRIGLVSITNLSDVTIDGVSPTGGARTAGFLTISTQNWTYRNIHATNTGPYSLYFWSNTYDGHAYDLLVDGGARIGLATVAASASSWVNIKILGSPLELVVTNSGSTFMHPELAPQSNTVYGMFMNGAGGTGTLTIIEPVCDSENPGALITCLYLTGWNSVSITGGDLDTYNTSPAYVDASTDISFLGTRFFPAVSSPSSEIHVVGATTNPIAIFNGHQGQTPAIPWVDAGVSSVAPSPKFTATLSPASVAANTCAEQTFSLTGILAGDIVAVNKPTVQAGLGIAGARASAANQIGINFCNTTGSPIVPTAAEAYTVGVIR